MMVRTTILHLITTGSYRRKTEHPIAPRSLLAAMGEMVMMVMTKARISPTTVGTTIPLQGGLRGLPPLPTTHHPPIRPPLRSAHTTERTATMGGATTGDTPGKRTELRFVRSQTVVSGGLGGPKPSTPSSRLPADRTIWLKHG